MIYFVVMIINIKYMKAGNIYIYLFSAKSLLSDYTCHTVLFISKILINIEFPNYSGSHQILTELIIMRYIFMGAEIYLLEGHHSLGRDGRLEFLFLEI